jgi:hypothetical protein
VQQNNDSDHYGARKLGGSSHLAREQCEDSVNHSFVALIFRIDLKGMGGLGTLGLLTSRFFLLEIECNKTMIQTIMVREI